MFGETGEVDAVDRIARRALAQTVLPGDTRIEFTDASLGLVDIVLHDATWREASDRALPAADRVRLRPSWPGWLRGRAGRAGGGDPETRSLPRGLGRSALRLARRMNERRERALGAAE